MEGDIISMHDIFLFKQTGVDDDGVAQGHFCAAGIRPQCQSRLETSGVRLPVEMFERRILSFVDAPGGRSTAELATQIGRTPRAVQQRLGRLAERGLVVAVGTSPRDPKRRWFLSGSAARGMHTPSRTKP